MKYLVVAKEYITKWIEAEPVAQITTYKIQHFVWKNIVCRFEIPKRFDENPIKEAFINEGRGHSPSHLKFFLLVFSKLKEDIK